MSAITNDPYTTAGMVTHLNDVFFLKPLFIDGEILCFVWAFIHCSDIGGKVPGSIDGTNREVFQEGLRIKSTKLYRAGVLNQDMVNVITSNCRSPEMNWGDLGAAISGLNRGEERLRQLIARYDSETVRGGMYRMLDRSEALTRAVLKEIPAGSYEFVEYLEDSYVSAVPIRAMLKLTSRGDGSVELDFTGSDPPGGLGDQHAGGRPEAPPDAVGSHHEPGGNAQRSPDIQCRHPAPASTWCCPGTRSVNASFSGRLWDARTDDPEGSTT